MADPMFVHVQKMLASCRIDVRLHSETANLIALAGPSGAGKTSVLNMVAGLLAPDSGRIMVNGSCLFDADKRVNLAPEKRRIGYVFQEARLFPHLSVQHNLLFGAHRRRQTTSLAVEFEQVVALLGIAALLARKPCTLSGGEQQRVAFGRAILSDPDLLLMDEPLAALDAERKQELLPFIRQLHKTFSLPVLYVSHSQDEIAQLTPHVLNLQQGKGQLVIGSCGSPAC